MQSWPGQFHWNELMTRNLKAAKTFYAAVCGWTYEAMEVDGMSYTIIMAGGQPAGGMFQMDGPEFENEDDHWGAFVAVEDADASAKAAVSGGGKVIRPPFDVTGIGRIALLQDQSGAILGVIKPAPMPDA